MHSLAKGNFIALCEGDDCWTDANKLYKQISIMEENPDYRISFHPVHVNEKKITKTSKIRIDKISKTKIEDI